MTTRLPEALPATSIGGGITDSLGYSDNINISLDDESSEAIIPILYPRSATVFAAICASIFTVVGIGGKDIFKYIVRWTKNRENNTKTLLLDYFHS